MEKIKSYSIVLLAAIILAILFRSFEQGRELDHYKNKVVGEDPVMTKYFNENGKQVAEIKNTLYTIEELQASKDSDIVELKKEVKKWSNLYAGLILKTSTSGTFTSTMTDTIVVIGKDTLKALGGTYADKWLTFDGIVTGKKLFGKYNVKNDSRIAWEYKKDKWYKKPNLVVGITSENPNTDVSSMKPITIAPRKKKFYETRGFTLIVGALGGFLLAK